MMKLLFYGFLIYALYRFVFNVVVPVSKASSQIKSTLQEMQAQQAAAAAARAQQEQAAQAQRQAKTEASKPAPKEDYIDFEEVKP
jgi:ribosomal protein L12E/L44/L45/RPP1/RPP2